MLSTLTPRGRLWAACVPTQAPIRPVYTPNDMIGWYYTFTHNPASEPPPIMLLHEVQLFRSEGFQTLHLVSGDLQLCGLHAHNGELLIGVDQISTFGVLKHLCRLCWRSALHREMISYL